MMPTSFAVAPKRTLVSFSALLLVLLALAGYGETCVTPPATPTAGTGTFSATLRDPAYWGPIVGLHDSDVVEHVSFGHLVGGISISPVNTVLTAQSDGATDPNDGPTRGGGLVQDLFREFKWSASARTFVQAAFPSLFPDLTRWQAEADQAKVHGGQVLTEH